MAPAAAPTPDSSLASTFKEASVFLVWGAALILLAHGMELLHEGRANWWALLIRVAWAALLLGQAALLRRAPLGVVQVGAVVAIFGSAALDLAIVAVTGRSASPLLWFTPVLAAVLPFMAFELVWVGLVGSAALLLGTELILLVDDAPMAAHIALANGGGGGLAAGWLLARAYGRARRAEEARRLELAEAMSSIKTLKGMLPVCSWCHRVRTDAGYWQQIESYVAQHSDATFTHGLCQDCFRQKYGDSPEDTQERARQA